MRFREAYIQLARQNGKSFLSGAKSIKTSNFSTYKKGKIICAATKMEQAKIVWEEVEKFILADEDLNEMYKIKRSDYEITAGATGTIIKPIGRDTKKLRWIPFYIGDTG